jgi:hypothetical protein
MLGGSSADSFAAMARSMQESAAAVSAIARSQTDKDRPGRGTPKGLRKEEEELVFLARGCGTHRVAVCPQVLGNNLFLAMKQASESAGGALRQAGWTIPMTNRIALGCAGGYWGGGDHSHLEKHSLGAADFPRCTQQQLDDHRTPRDETIEARPRLPVTQDDWVRRARNGINVWCLVYGIEYREVLENALSGLEALHEEQPNVFPRDQVWAWWEELHWRFWEELKETLRKLKHEAQLERFTSLTDLKNYALVPPGDGKQLLPLAFELDHPNGWFRQEIIPRLERKHQRAMWENTWKAALAGRPRRSRGGGARHREGGRRAQWGRHAPGPRAAGQGAQQDGVSPGDHSRSSRRRRQPLVLGTPNPPGLHQGGRLQPEPQGHEGSLQGHPLDGPGSAPTSGRPEEGAKERRPGSRNQDQHSQRSSLGRRRGEAG